MDFAHQMALFLELTRVQDAFLAAAPRSPNIRGHKDIIVLASAV
jgi:hypothetical protein